jgi:hypothetical protein
LKNSNVELHTAIRTVNYKYTPLNPQDKTVDFEILMSSEEEEKIASLRGSQRRSEVWNR